MVETALILAAGESERWGGIAKQLVSVGDETLVERIIRQLRARELRPVVITHRPDIIEASRGGYVPFQRDTILKTILSTRPLWHGLTAIFFGDVIFSEETLDLLWARRRFPVFIGNGGENFIIAFDDHDGMHKGLLAVIAQGGHLSWHLYRQLAGLPMEPHFIPPAEKRVVYLQTDETDYTDDIDTPPKYEHLLARLRQKGVIDAKTD